MSELALRFEDEMEKLADVMDNIKNILSEAPPSIRNRAELYWFGYLEAMTDIESQGREIMIMPWQTLAELQELED